MYFLNSIKLVLQIFMVLKTYSDSTNIVLPVCKNYFPQNYTNISIPSSAIHALPNTFENNTVNYFTIGSTQSVTLNCEDEEIRQHIVLWNASLQTTATTHSSLHKRFRSTLPSHFTKAGYYYDEKTRYYYRPSGDFCLETYENNRVTLNVCEINESSDKSNPTNNRWYLPKCCALDEVYIFWKNSCSKRNETAGVTTWNASIYQGPANPNVKIDRAISTKNFVFRKSYLSEKCVVTETLDDGSSVSFYQIATATSVPHPSGDSINDYEGNDLRLVIPSEKGSGFIRPMVFHILRRRWEIADFGEFCLEAFHVDGTNYTIPFAEEEHNFLIVYCGGFTPEINTLIPSIYFGVSAVALFFALTTIVVYLSVWKYNGLRELTIFNFIFAISGSYGCLMLAHIISIYPETLGYYAGLFERGWPCYLIGVSAHFFCLSRYFWLLIMNFTMWLKFRSMRVQGFNARLKPITTHLVKRLLFAWGTPAVLVGVFVGVNEVYRDPYSGVPVPDYGTETCFVTPVFRAEFVFIPLGLLLAINGIFILLTIIILMKGRKNSKKLATSARTSDRYRTRLFLKLFVLMGGTYFVDFFTWHHQAMDNHWIIHVLECVSYLTPIVLFILFCCNGRILCQLQESYPRIFGKRTKNIGFPPRAV